MKKIYLFIMVALTALSQTSCSDDDRVFSESAANRMENAITEYKSLLVSAKNGWRLEMFAGENQEYGGANIYLKFNEDGTVTAMSDVDTNEYAGTSVSSYYEFVKEQGPVLAFTTYNSALHYWSEPSSSDVDGMESDYEFIVTSASADEFVLKGKKHGVTLHMYALDSTSWEDSMTQLIAMRNNCASLRTVAMYVGTEMFACGSIEESILSISSDDDDFEKSFVTTATGFKFYDSMTVAGKQIDEFTYDAISNSFKAVGADNIIIKYMDTSVSLDTYLTGKWNFSYTCSSGNVSEDVTFTKNDDGTLTMNGDYFPLVFSYDTESGMLNITSQYVGMYKNTYYLKLLPSDNKVLYSSPIGFVSKTTKYSKKQQILSFVSNGYVSNLPYLFVYAYSDKAMTSGVGLFDYYMNMKLTLTK